MEGLPEQTAFAGKRIVCFGPESTGKSRLTEELGKHFQAPTVSEYMREYLQKKWDDKNQSCNYEDLVPITAGQIENENAATRDAKNMVFCDTNPRQLKVYAEVYYKRCPAVITEFLDKSSYAHYLLLDIDVKWVKDDLRDKPHERQCMFQKFRRELNANEIPYTVISGQGQDRLDNAITAVEKLFE